MVHGQKRERRGRPVKIASDMQKDLAARKIHFYSHYIYVFYDLKRNFSKFKTFLRP